MVEIQRVRNLTTGILHTDLDFVYEDLSAITGLTFFTQEIPNACRALHPYLREHIGEDRFWTEKWDRDHVGEIDIPAMTDDHRAAFLERYRALPSPLSLIGSNADDSKHQAEGG